AIDISNGPGSPEWFVFTSAHFPTAQNRYTGQNHGSFHDDEVDRLQATRLAAIDPTARENATVALYQRVSELVAVGVLYYVPELFMARNRLRGPVGDNTVNPATCWNIYEWELTD